jgi:hypothetical protein
VAAALEKAHQAVIVLSRNTIQPNEAAMSAVFVPIALAAGFDGSSQVVTARHLLALPDSS